MKKVVLLGDPHCGSVYGITPPEEWKASKYRKLQEESWEKYLGLTKQWPAPDVLIANGDLIEGNQSRQGGAELVTADRSVQCDMALRAIEIWKPKKVFLTYGTAYHVGEKAEDFERGIMERLNDRGISTVIEGHLFLNIEGKIFDIRHKVGTSSIPHGRGTPLLRAMMWALCKEAKQTAPHVDILIRSHAHYYLDIKTSGPRAIILPGLQIARGRFGSRECEGDIDWGAMRLTIHKGKIIQEEVDLCTLKSNAPTVFKVK